MLQYPSGAMAQLFSSFQLETKQDAYIYGQMGYIQLKEFWHGTEVALHTAKEDKTWSFPFLENGFEYEILEVAHRIAAEELESPVITHKMSLEMAGIMDQIIKTISSI